MTKQEAIMRTVAVLSLVKFRRVGAWVSGLMANLRRCVPVCIQFHVIARAAAVGCFEAPLMTEHYFRSLSS